MNRGAVLVLLALLSLSQAQEPAILVQPASQLDVVPGQDAVFTVNASGDGLTYQWQRDSVNLTDTLDQYSGSNSSSLTVLSVEEDDQGNYTCVVTASDGNSTTTDVAQLAVRNRPIVGQSPESEITRDAGDTVEFAVNASGVSLMYQWQRNETDLDDTSPRISGSTTSQLSVLNVEESDEGSYRCVVSNGNTPNSVATSDPIQLTVLNPPVITMDPVSLSDVNPGSQVMFSVTASADPAGGTITYQWRQNGTDIMDDDKFSGATTGTLTISDVQESDQATYECVVTNNDGVDVREATLDVRDRPTIVNQLPESELTAFAGDTVDFAVNASGAALMYQWQRNETNLDDTSPRISGSTTSQLSVLNVEESDEGSYRCVVSNGNTPASVATSDPIQLTVLNPPVITVDPVSLSDAIPGSQVMFSVTASADPAGGTITYQWRQNGTDIVDDAKFSGATTDTLTISDVQESDEGSFDCDVSNDDGDASSSTVTLDVRDPPTIVSQLPDSELTAFAGDTVFFAVNASGVSLMYQWQMNETDLDDTSPGISGSTTPRLTVMNVEESDEDSYRCVVSNGNTSASVATSDPIQLTVLYTVEITVDPVSLSDAIPGTQVMFSVTASADPAGGTLNYQWRVNGTDIVDDAKFSGATTDTLTISDVQESDQGSYDCNVSNDDDDASSSTVTLDVLDLPAFMMQPSDQRNIERGDNANFSVVVVDASNVTYQWRLDDEDIEDGDNFTGTATPMLTVLDVQDEDVGPYTCAVTNRAGTTVSGIGWLTILGQPAIVTNPVDATAGEGGNVEFSCTATGADLNTITWFFVNSSGFEIGVDPGLVSPSGNATYAASTLTLTAIGVADRGQYFCEASNTAGSAQSSLARLYVPVIQPIINQTASYTVTVAFFCDVEDESPGLSFLWERLVGSAVVDLNDTRITGIDTDRLQIGNVGRNDAGVYRCTISNDDSGIVDSEDTILIAEGPTLVSGLSDDNLTLSAGDALELSCSVNNSVGSLPIRFDWFQNSVRITEGVSPVMEDGLLFTSTLTVMSVGAVNSGGYKCRATNREVADAVCDETNVRVLFGPTLTFPSGNELSPINQRFAFTCTALADPPPAFVEISRVNETGALIPLNRNENPDGDMLISATRTINSVSANQDNQVFVCTSEIDANNTAEQNFTLIVQEPPEQVDHNAVSAVNVSLTSVRITWPIPANNNDEITSYRLEFCAVGFNSTMCVIDSGGNVTTTIMLPAGELDVDGNLVSYTIGELSFDTRFLLTIQAENSIGLGPSPNDTFIFYTATADEGRPINFQTVVATDQSVLFTWELLDITAGATVDSYNITFNIAGGSTGGSQLSTGPRVLIDELTPGRNYEFSVVANFAIPPFISVASMHRVATLANIGDLDPLVNEEPSDSIVADRIGITWTATTDLPPNLYRVMYTFIRLDGSGRSKRQDGMGSEIVNGTSFELSPVEAFSDYTFNVFGQYDLDGEFVEVPATPPLTVTSADESATAPLNVQVTQGFLVSLEVTWEPPMFPNGIIDGYRITYGSQVSGVAGGERPTTLAPPFFITNLEPNTPYTVQVAAMNDAGDGALSDTEPQDSPFGVDPPTITQVNGPELGQAVVMRGSLSTRYGAVGDFYTCVSRDNTVDTRSIRTADLRPFSENDQLYVIEIRSNSFTTRNTVIGDDSVFNLNGIEYANPRLDGNTDYYFFLRQLSQIDGSVYNDTAFVGPYRFASPLNPGVIIGPIAAFAVILLLVFVVLLIVALVTHRTPLRGFYSPEEGGADGKRRGRHHAGAIELRRTKLFSPTLTVGEADCFTSAGQPTTLICEASGTPQPEVSWTRNGEPLDGERFIQLADSSLFINDTDLQDEGVYVVTATNSAGTTDQDVRLTVLRPVPPEPDEEHPSIAVGDFTEKIALLRANDDEGLEDEYADVELDWTFTSYASKLNINRNKNRYVNIIPYDHSRIVLALQDNTPGSDYINGSYVDGYNKPNAYIATQGPIPSSCADFWRMVWENDCPTIVMVTNLKEEDKVKCNQYWPSYGTTTYGNVQVSLKEVENLAEYSIRTFNVSPLAGQSKAQMPIREVRQFHFLVWPDHGVPTYATALLSFRKRVFRYHPPKRGPMVVHCSAGVGRTGTFITIDYVLQQIEAEGVIDIFNFVRHMRFRRNYMVQTSPQYVFIYDAILESLMCGDNSIQAPELPKKIQNLREVNPTSGKSGFASLFETLAAASPAEDDFDCTIAQLGDNAPKNRLKDNLPSNELRVALSTENGQSDYICASFLDGYRQRNAFIVTQAPTSNTIGDFWRMVWEYKSAAVVMLTELEEDNTEMCVKYWPSGVGEAEAFGEYQVELSEDEKDRGDYITRRFKISALSKPQDSRIVTQFHFTRWPKFSSPKNAKTIIDLIDELQRVQRKSGNGPITVHCDDGIGRTGAFCVLYYVLERVKTEQVVDVFQAAKTLRIQRSGLLQTLDQYEFVHRAVVEFLNAFSDYQNFK